MKKILSVQDLSCVGRCSLTVALPVLSAQGIACSVLPTAVLSTHTAFPQPEVVDLSDHLDSFVRHWQENSICFDAVSVGYLADSRQAAIVEDIVERLNCPLILDPVMGDRGKLYRRITPAHIDGLKRLAARAEVLLPNLTEAAALTGLAYREQTDDNYLNALTEGLLALGAKAVIITGVHFQDSAIGFYGRARSGEAFCYQGDYIPRQFHGTGDLFAAVLSGQFVKGSALPQAAEKAADFVRLCVEQTPEVTPMGVEFEPLLYRLADHR